jgi:hypothetical protein
MSMHRAMAVVIAVLTSLLVVAQPAAAETTESSQDCAAGTFCTWSGTGYTGDPRQLYDGPNGTCTSYVVVPYRGSYINNTNIEGYFFSENNCTGQSRGVTYNSRSDNIGFAAGSFRIDCVSCRSENQ